AIQASVRFIVVPTISPATLHILDTATLNVLHTITAPNLALPVFSPSRRLLAYASTPPPPSASPTPTTARQSPNKVQADISMAIEGVRKVSAGVWSGAETLLKDGATSRSPAPLTRSPAPMSPPLGPYSEPRGCTVGVPRLTQLTRQLPLLLALRFPRRARHAQWAHGAM
ncbi:hypothetical protein FS749_000792, partial [Ceratobasidium sp. UAMH 11750]